MAKAECPTCHQTLTFQEAHIGRVATCPHCGREVRLQTHRAPAPTAPPAVREVTLLPPPAPPPQHSSLIIDATPRSVRWPHAAVVGAIAGAALIGILGLLGLAATVALWSRSQHPAAVTPPPVQQASPLHAGPVTVPDQVTPAAELPTETEEEREIREAREHEKMRRLLDVAFVDADRFASEFSINGVAAQSKYEGRMIRIRGRVAVVTTNKDGLPLVMLKTRNSWSVRVFIADSGVEDVSRLRPGEDVMLLCGFGAVQGTLIDLAGGVLSDESMDAWLKKR